MATPGFDADRAVTPLEREAIANVEVGHTTITPLVARVTIGWFLILLTFLPAYELVGNGLPAGVVSAAVEIPADAGLWQRTVTINRTFLQRLHAFEAALEDQSAVGRALRPRTQLVLSGVLGAGNERVYVGRDRWLFYRADVEFVTGRGFLEARTIERRARAASEYERPPHADPRPAIRQFKRDLDARGIALVLVPTPVKPTIHPRHLSRRNVAGPPLHNPSYDAFVSEMRSSGVLVFDPATTIRSETAHYLLADTHWRPETMEGVAGALAQFIAQHVSLSAIAPPDYQAAPREAQQVGDIAAMLDLPRDQMLYPPERVRLRFITDRAGDAWRPVPTADILLLGDSFTNIYSLPSMGWGEAAGLAEQLSYVLQRPIDRLVQNDHAAHATRELLRRAMAGGQDRLAGKRVVIWQFAARELAFGDWRMIELP